MKIKRYICNLMRAVALAGIIIPVGLNAGAMVEGQWNYITSFNPHSTISNNAYPNHVRRIIDGKRYAYFLVHSRSYKHSIIDGTNHGTASHAAPVLFRADNTAPVSADAPAELKPIASLPGIGGTSVFNAEYNGESGCLAVAFTNGNIGLLYDSGEVVNITDFANMRIPGLKEVRNITFDTDNNRIYFAGIFGFCVVDMREKAVVDLCITQYPLDYAFRCGNHIVAITETLYRKVDGKNTAQAGKVYAAPYNEGISDWNAFHPLTVDEEVSKFTTSTAAADIEKNKNALLADGELTGASWAAPFNETTFCLMNGTTGTRAMTLLTPGNEGKWNLLFVENQSFRYEALDNFQISFYEGFCSRWERGWAMPVGSNYRMFDTSVTPDFGAANPIKDYTDRALSTKNLYPENAEVLYKERRFSSYDATTGWVYEPFKGFKKAERTTESGTWRDLTALSLPEGPVVSLTANMAWHPETGLIIRQFGKTYNYDPNVQDADHMSIRKDGKWVDYSMLKVSPTVAAGLNDPRGVAIDPMHPNYIYCGSKDAGIVRRNLDDPEDVLFLGCSGQGSKTESLPGFVDAFPFQSGWKGLCDVSQPRFDAEGNLWFHYRDFTAAQSGIYKWERADIDASLNAHKDASVYKPMKSWSFTLGKIHGINDYYPLNHPSNAGVGIVALGESHSQLFIVDFSKSEQNPDTYSLSDFQDEFGNALTVNGRFCFSEDLKSGKVWFGNDRGLGWISNEDVRKGHLVYHNVEIKSAKSNQLESSPLEMNVVFHIIIDEYGRMWCGTLTGLYCLSSDGKEVLAHFNKANSPLESNEIKGLCWDGSTHSLIVSTYEGLFEFTPYESCDPADIERVRIWPSAVEPDFNGWVSLSGVPTAMKLSLSDGKGNKVALPSAESGMIQWDLTTNGKRQPAGRYNVVETSTDRKLGEIVIY